MKTQEPVERLWHAIVVRCELWEVARADQRKIFHARKGGPISKFFRKSNLVLGVLLVGTASALDENPKLVVGLLTEFLPRLAAGLSECMPIDTHWCSMQTLQWFEDQIGIDTVSDVAVEVTEEGVLPTWDTWLLASLGLAKLLPLSVTILG